MNDQVFFSLFISGTILLVVFVFFLIAYLLVQKGKQNTYQLEKSKMIYDHQNKLLIARIEEQERTMNQISREIHDNIGQILSFTKMNITVINKYAIEQRQKELLEKTTKLVDSLIRDVLNISHTLNGDYIKGHGLVSILQDELDYFTLSQDIQCKIDIVGDQKTFSPDKELLIYRIAQETIHNISKHAQASKITITLTYESDTFTMSISDNGIGFEKNKIFELNGIGFLNMLQRAKLLNGNLEIQSQPLSGCTITLNVPDVHGLIALENSA